MPISPARRGHRRGVAAVECAAALIFLIPLLLGVWEVGRLVSVQQLLSNGAREGGRQASTGLKTSAEVRTGVLTYLQNAGLSKLTAVAANADDLAGGGKVLVDVRVYDTADNLRSGVDASAALQNERIEVTVIILYKDVSLSPTAAFLEPDAQVKATVSWRSMKDIPITVNNTIPLQ
jgi:Flp pilus assembly protein TadG